MRLPVRTLIAALVAGVLVRLLVIFIVDYRFDAGDAVLYDLIARNLLEHGVFSADLEAPLSPAVVRPPLYPGVVALAYAVSGSRHLAVQLLQVLIALTTGVVLAHSIARESKRLAVWTLWACMLSPFDAVYNGALVTETLCAALLVVSMVLLVESSRWWQWLLCGAAMGGLFLTRDVYLLLLPALCVALMWMGWRSQQLRSRLPAAGLVLAGALVMVIPWTARNHISAGQGVLISSGGGSFWHALWIGTWERDVDWMADRTIPEYAWIDGTERETVARAVVADDEQRNAMFHDLVVRRIKQRPFQTGWAWIRRAPGLWFGTRFEPFGFRPTWLKYGTPVWVLLKGAMFALNGLVLLLAALGIVGAFRRHRGLLWLLIPILYTQAVYLPFHTELRYSQPVHGFLIVFAVVGALGLWTRLTGPRRVLDNNPS